MTMHEIFSGTSLEEFSLAHIASPHLPARVAGNGNLSLCPGGRQTGRVSTFESLTYIPNIKHADLITVI